jgi:CubicO group peptidase (beta-lactamase class C family)
MDTFKGHQQDQGPQPDTGVTDTGMKRMRIFHGLLVAALFLLPIHAVQAAKADPQTEQKLDAFFQHHLERIRSPGFAVALVDREGPIFARGYGVEVLGQSKPMTPDSIMAIGSLTKSFTAMAILQLEEQGKLSVDDKVTKYLPWFRTADKSISDQITLRMFLNNASGLQPYFNTMLRNLSRGPDALEKGVRAMSSYKATRQPGESYEYFNEGWNVLGLVLEKVTGEPYEKYIGEHILQPLQMKRSSTDRAVLETLPVLTGHNAGIDPWPAEFLHLQGALPAGAGLYSTVNDLGNYLMALMNGGELNGQRVLTPASIEKMWTPAIPLVFIPHELGGTGEPAHYAMGYFVLEIDGVHYVGHGGEFGTMSSFALIDADHDVAIALLYNTASNNAYYYETHIYAMVAGLRLLLDLPPSEFAIPRQPDPTINDFKPESGQLVPFIGAYVSPNGRRLDVQAGGSEGLQGFLSDGLYPADFDVDFVNSTNVMLRNIRESKPGTFTVDAAGKVSSFRMDDETFGRKAEVAEGSMQSFESSALGLNFQLPKGWTLQWEENGFEASDTKLQLGIEKIPMEFEQWRAEAQVPADVVATGELRNGYFFQNVVSEDGQGALTLNMHCNYRGANYLLTLHATEGELSPAIITVLNPFLDTLTFR